MTPKEELAWELAELMDKRFSDVDPDCLYEQFKRLHMNTIRRLLIMWKDS